MCPSSEPPSHLHPHPNPQGHPSAPALYFNCTEGLKMRNKKFHQVLTLGEVEARMPLSKVRWPVGTEAGNGEDKMKSGIDRA